jgi:hypothetical protein
LNPALSDGNAFGFPEITVCDVDGNVFPWPMATVMCRSSSKGDANRYLLRTLVFIRRLPVGFLPLLP